MTNVRLNDLQLMLLSSASARDDGSLLPYPKSVTDPARAAKAIEQLLNKGLVEEHPDATKADLWRENGDQPFRVVVTDAGRTAINAGVEPGTPDSGAEPSAPTLEPTNARQTKRAQLIELLSRDGGASLDELVAALGWLPHTTRAAMTGLRKAGMTVDSEKADGVRRYRITTTA